VIKLPFFKPYKVPPLRIGYTIILNGLHHLTHRNYAEFLAQHLDYWVIIDGAVGSTGSTSWCNTIPAEFHNNGSSVDGTVDFLKQLSEKYPTVRCQYAQGLWANKDDKINAALDIIRTLTPHCFLWQIDIDEQWTEPQFRLSELELVNSRGKTGCFLADFYVGKNLFAVGEWGESTVEPYMRLWNWQGERYASHEPPILEGGNGKRVLLSPRFQHYAYYFEQDVAFKDAWYGDHQGILKRWKDLQSEVSFPQPVSRLISFGKWGQSKTLIVKK